MSLIAESTIQEVNARADAVSVIGDYVRLEKKGGRYWGLCPFHNEKTPSFSVEPDRKFFYCFGCGKGGGLVQFVMELEKISFPEAVEQMAKKLGVEVRYEGSDVHRREDGAAERLDSLAELYARVAGSFQYILAKTQAGAFVREYLTSRAINSETVERFRLGYAPADRYWLRKFLSKKGYSEDFLTSSGLFSKKRPKAAFFADRLVFPIADRRAKTVAFGARLLRGEGPKYLNSPESELFKKGENLFALDLAMNDIRRTKEAHICEGYMDVLAMHQAGIGTAVAPLGTAFTEEQAKLLRRWAERVYLVFDSDEAGRAAAVKAIHTCRKVSLPCSVVTVEGGKDPADILRDLGAEALQKVVKCYINDFDYLVDRARALFDITDSEGLAHAVAFLFPYMETLESEVSRDACVGAIADAFGVERSAVINDFARRSEHRREDRRINAAPARADIRMNDELFLLLAVVVNRSLYQKLRASLSPEDFDDTRAKEIFVALEESFRNESADMDSLLGRVADEDLRSFVLARGASDAFSVNPERMVTDGISRIKQKSLERRRSEILVRMRIAQKGQSGADDELDELVSEKMHIDAELDRLKDVHE